MVEESVSAAVEEIIATTMQIDRRELEDETPFGADGLDADSLTIVEMAEIVDMKLGVEIPDEDLAELDTVGDMKTYISDRHE